ncbi:MAG: CCA tRNA nucleotidyltransferase [Clostridia bacterium]|nr:CCA tRNA nucleotidyltransferase [Clostridia bacterium]
MKIEVPKSLELLVKSAGVPVYLVGGYVRNSLRGLKPTDIDLTGPCPVSALKLSPKYRVKTVNFRLGTAQIKYGKEVYEYTPFRVENYDKGHTPSEVFFTTDIRQDALRRDFTCNSVYYDILADELIDFVGGISDIEKGILRCHKPERILSSDGLRILRLVRFACSLGFKIEGATATAAMAKAELLKDITPERKREELDKMLVADTVNGVDQAHYRAMKLLGKMGLFKYLIPEVEQCISLMQNEKYHKYDVAEHTFRTVAYAPPKVRLAALFHDLGKAYCMEKHGNMHGHEVVSARIAERRMGYYGLRYSNDEIAFVKRLVLNHMYDMSGNTSDAKVRRFVARNFDVIDDLVDLINADKLATGMVTREQVGESRFTAVKWDIIESGAPVYIGDLEIDGTDCHAAGLDGEQIGAFLKDMLDICLLNPQLNNREWLFEHARMRAESLQKDKSEAK